MFAGCCGQNTTEIQHNRSLFNYVFTALVDTNPLVRKIAVPRVTTRASNQIATDSNVKIFNFVGETNIFTA